MGYGNKNSSWNQSNSKVPKKDIGKVLTDPMYSTVVQLAIAAFGQDGVSSLLSTPNLSAALPVNSAFTPSIVNTYKGLSPDQQQTLLLNHFWAQPASETSIPNQTSVLPSAGKSSVVINTDGQGSISTVNNVTAADFTTPLTNGGSITPISQVLTTPVQLLGNCSCSS